MEMKSKAPLGTRDNRHELARRTTNYYMKKRQQIHQQRSISPHHPKIVSQLNNRTLQMREQVSLPRRKINQPRQRRGSQRTNESALSNLSYLAKEMKDMFSKIPDQRTNKSVQFKQVLQKRVPRHSPRDRKAISLRNKNALKQQMRAYSVRRGVQEIVSGRYRSTGRRSSKNLDVDSFQKFFAEFHTRSKLLLSELERNVLGEKK